MSASLLAAYLAAQGQGTVGTDILIGRWSDRAPDAAVLVVETAGSAPLEVMGSGYAPRVRPAYQVSVRAKTYVAAEAKAWAVWKVIAAMVEVNVNPSGSVIRMTATPTGSPAPLERDQADRSVWVLNFTATLDTP